MILRSIEIDHPSNHLLIRCAMFFRFLFEEFNTRLAQGNRYFNFFFSQNQAVRRRKKILNDSQFPHWFFCVFYFGLSHVINIQRGGEIGNTKVWLFIWPRMLWGKILMGTVPVVNKNEYGVPGFQDNRILRYFLIKPNSLRSLSNPIINASTYSLVTLFPILSS